MLTRSTVPQLRSALLEALSRGGPHLVLDLAAVGRIDDFGLDALQRTAARARLEGGDLHVAAPTPAVAARLRSSGVAWRLSVHRSLTAAVAAVAARTGDGHALEEPDGAAVAARPAGTFGGHVLDEPDPDEVGGHVPAVAGVDTAETVDAHPNGTRRVVPVDEVDGRQRRW